MKSSSSLSPLPPPPKKSPTLKSIDFPSLVLLLASSATVSLPQLTVAAIAQEHKAEEPRRTRRTGAGTRAAVACFYNYLARVHVFETEEMVGSTKTLKTEKKQPACEVDIARKNDMPDAGRFVLGCYTLAVSKVLPKDLQTGDVVDSPTRSPVKGASITSCLDVDSQSVVE
ncbi:hypothetical protein Tsubulata_045317 [Turnera subulata]|uniref:Uncharacterized protein n=1 Tax=Turnera subulata TaxID=218843 RepID=A0A9Q0FDF1_9ROSI|nr:hypothetical protein Tsubulata_047404 [Turnera subulata]KAJ4829450.1 hypothetical protein Tsubulata_045317 [Turnera subulata]